MANHRLFSVSYPLNTGAATSNANKVYLKYEREQDRGNDKVGISPALCVGFVGRDTSATVTDEVFGIDLVQDGEAILGIPDIIEPWAYDDYLRDTSDGRRRKNFGKAIGTTAGTNQLASEAFNFGRVHMVGVLIFGAEIPVLIGAGDYDSVVPGEPVVGSLGGPKDSTGTTLGDAAAQPGYVKGAATDPAGTAYTLTELTTVVPQISKTRVLVTRKVSAADSDTRDGVAYLTIG